MIIKFNGIEGDIIVNVDNIITFVFIKEKEYKEDRLQIFRKKEGWVKHSVRDQKYSIISIDQKPQQPTDKQIEETLNILLTKMQEKGLFDNQQLENKNSTCEDCKNYWDGSYCESCYNCNNYPRECFFHQK